MIYGLVTGFMHFWYRFWFNVKVTGLENIPKEGGVIVCGNHKSNHDAVLVASFFGRKMKFLAKKELFGHGLEKFVRGLGGIPVDRQGTDIAAVKASLRTLKNGEPLLIFPQGTRCKDLKEEDFKEGAPFMAIKAKVPVLPIGIGGEYKFGGGLTLNIGKPIDCANPELSTDRLAQQIYKNIEELVKNG